ncbi:NADPH-dependent F420 reductase [Silvanigrella sp.]|jgi:predicted dinucleotide-binding enzyme|uniref:NADPH-dependent F420 reductase n=1 Tax=Silvanigrella sp. TaxID=2024976 RepID=UPI0037C7400B
MNISFIGSGNVGGTLAKKLFQKGHKVFFGVRDVNSDKNINLKKELGISIEINSIIDSILKADIIYLATPWNAVEDLIKSISSHLKNKILIDCTNPLKKDLSGLEVGHNTSGSEIIQNLAPECLVYKSFNTTGFNIMEDPILENRKTIMFFCSNDQKNRNVVAKLIEDIGFESLDVGPLSSARLLEPFALLWIQSAYKFGMGRDFSFGILRRK